MRAVRMREPSPVSLHTITPVNADMVRGNCTALPYWASRSSNTTYNPKSVRDWWVAYLVWLTQALNVHRQELD